MNKQQLEQLGQVRRRVLTGADLVDKTPRTLLYGYTTDRNTWHVYLDADARIHLVCYSTRLLMSHQTQDTLTDNRSYLPNKRLYPESCDYEFCALLTQADESLPFTTYDDGNDAARREARPAGLQTFAGLLAAELGEEAVYLSKRDIPGVTDAKLGVALLLQAISELAVVFAEAYDGFFVGAADKTRTLERAHALHSEFAKHGVSFKDGESIIAEHLMDLGLFGVSVNRLEQCGGTLSAEVSFSEGIDADKARDRGFDVSTYEARGTRVQRQVKGRRKTTSPAPVDMVLVEDLPGHNRMEKDHRVFLHAFGDKAQFLKHSAMYCR